MVIFKCFFLIFMPSENYDFKKILCMVKTVKIFDEKVRMVQKKYGVKIHEVRKKLRETKIITMLKNVNEVLKMFMGLKNRLI